MSRPKIKLDLTEKDLGWGHIKAEMAKMAKKPFVKVGYQGESGVKRHTDPHLVGPALPNTPTVVDIATFHEFGTSKVPERSHLRATMDRNAPKYQATMAELKDKILDPKSGINTEKALGLMGQMATGDVKAYIRAGISPPLAESTIRRKNKRQIAKAQGTLNALEGKLNTRDYKNALRKGGRGRGTGKLTAAETKREHAASETVMTGGKSTPLIDSAQMINALHYKVDMTGNVDGATSMMPRKGKR